MTNVFILETDAHKAEMPAVVNQEKGSDTPSRLLGSKSLISIPNKSCVLKMETFAAVTLIENFTSYVAHKWLTVQIDNQALLLLKAHSVDEGTIGRNFMALTSIRWNLNLALERRASLRRTKANNLT